MTMSNSYVYRTLSTFFIKFDLFTDPARPFYQSAKMFPLGKISSKELEAFVYERFRTTGKQLSRQVAARLVETCESHPYYVQYVSHSLWEITSSDSAIRDEDLDKAIGVTISRASPRYESVWELPPIGQRQALIALTSFHPEMALFRNLGVNLRNCLCDVPMYASAQSLDFLDLAKNCSFLNWKLTLVPIV